MALDKRTITVQLGRGGLDTKTDDTDVISGRFLTLENVTFQRPGSFRKRNGFAALGTGIGSPQTARITVGQAIASYQNQTELVTADASQLYSYNAANMAWISKGSFVSVNVSQVPIVRNTAQQTGQDSAVHSNGLQVFAWEDSTGGSRYSVVDSTTRQTVVPSTLINANAIKPKALAIGSFIVLLYVNTADGNLYGAAISATAPAAALVPVALTIANGTSTSLNAASPNYDATVITTAAGPQLYTAFNTNQGGGGTTIHTFAAANPTSRIAAVNLAGEVSTVVNVFGELSQGAPILAYWNGTAVKFKAYNAALTTVLGTGTIETIANVALISGVSLSSSSVSCRVFYSTSAAATYNYLTRVCTIVNQSGPVGTVWIPLGGMMVTSPGDISFSAAAHLRSVALAGKALAFNGTAYAPLVYQSPLQPTYFLADSAGNLVAKVFYSNAGNIPVRSDGRGAAMLPESNALGSGKYQIAWLEKDQLTVTAGQAYTQTGVSSVTLNFFDPANSYLRAEIADVLHLSGGFLSMYDGTGPVEHGFHLFPEPVTGVAAGSGGSLSAGTYQGCAVYEWRDAQGNTHRSAPSIAASVTAVSNDKITWTIPTLRLTAKQGTRSAVSVVFYRTQANGSIFYQDSSTTAPTANSTTADTVTFSSTQADATITGNGLLYTTGGVVENIAPNPVSALATHRNRLWLLDSTDGGWWYSKEIVPGTPAEFSDLLRYRLDPRGGPSTAGASLDDKWIIFKGRSIFVTLGEGPDLTGGQNSFTDAQLISSDVGCSNPRSIVTITAPTLPGGGGLIFQSQKGFYMLDRSLQASYIGADVEAYNSQTVTSAQLIPNTNEVRFTLSSGVALVYDYLVKEWSVSTNVNAVDSTIWQGLFTYFQPSGATMQETPGTFNDNGAFIKMRLVTSWLQFAGVQGFQRIWHALIVGSYFSPHLLQVGFAHDFNPSVTQTSIATPQPAALAFDVETPFAGGTDAAFAGGSPTDPGATVYQWTVHLTQQKTQAVQITLEDLPSGAPGQSMSLSALTFYVGIKRGPFPQPASRQIG